MAKVTPKMPGRWEYRNVSPGMDPPCPVCGLGFVKRPGNPSGKYQCEAVKCRATFQARWVPDESAAVRAQVAEGEGQG